MAWLVGLRTDVHGRCHPSQVITHRRAMNGTIGPHTCSSHTVRAPAAPTGIAPCLLSLASRMCARRAITGRARRTLGRKKRLWRRGCWGMHGEIPVPVRNYLGVLECDGGGEIERMA